MKALSFEELAKMEAIARCGYGCEVILKTKGTFGEATFWWIKNTKAVFSKGSRRGWVCPNISTYGKTWVVYPKNSKKSITQLQFNELNQLEENDQKLYNKKLKELFGIRAEPFTAYEYFCGDKCIGNSFESYPIDLLNKIGVEIDK